MLKVLPFAQAPVSKPGTLPSWCSPMPPEDRLTLVRFFADLVHVPNGPEKKAAKKDAS